MFSGPTMRTLFLLCSAVAFVVSPVCGQSSARPDEVQQQADDIVSVYRKIIVLTADDAAIDADARDRVLMLGKMLFQQNEEKLAALRLALSSSASKFDSFLNR